ncbi:MAG: prepilin-type N-terminal cleavage/methylation domain-containing protein [Candidatus Berkelbacteria bacterium]|nr:prepilin-type N-terminal cleavage/methylation domain-containing protein [Candidatus Berkelbacteria bacterium]
MKKSKAFTLIELLVVVAIIAILAVVVVTSVQNATARANFAKALSDMTEIATAANVYKVENGAYPGNDVGGPPWWLGSLESVNLTWPTPPCPQHGGLFYDWDVFGANVTTNDVQISLRRPVAGTPPLLLLCLSPKNGVDCTQDTAPDVRYTPDRTLKCP